MPPRKRLLAGMNKQNTNDQSHTSTSSSPPTPNEVDSCFKGLLSSHSNSISRSSLEEIVESLKKTALAAAKVAEAARATVEEKAAVAARAIAAAKSALELVAAFCDETLRRDKRSIKGKSKKQVTVQSLYKKREVVENDSANESLSSFSISKHWLSVECKSLKHKGLKISSERTAKVPNRLEGDSLIAICNGNTTLGTEGSICEVFTFRVEGKFPKSHKFDQFQSKNWKEGPPNHFKDKSFGTTDDSYPNGTNRGRIKLKKMPLSICSSKD